MGARGVRGLCLWGRAVTRLHRSEVLAPTASVVTSAFATGPVNRTPPLTYRECLEALRYPTTGMVSAQIT